MALTAAEQQELSGLQADPQAQGAYQAPAQGLSASEQAELHQLSNDPDVNPAPSKLATGLNVLGKGLDWARGVASPAMAGLVSLSSGVPFDQIMKPGEWTAGVYPTTTRRAPGTATMLERAGVPQQGHLSDILPDGIPFQPAGSGENKPWYAPSKYAPEKGGMLDVTGRGVEGGILDMAADPLTYASFGVNKVVQAAKAAGEELSPALRALSKMLNPASNTVEAFGQHQYDKGMAPLIVKGNEFGKDISDTLYNQGIWGRSSKIAQMGDEAAEKLKASRDSTMKSAQDVIDQGEVPFMTPIKPKEMPWSNAPDLHADSQLDQQMALPGHELEPDMFRQETPPGALRSLQDLRSTPTAIGAEREVKQAAPGTVQGGTSSFIGDPENTLKDAAQPNLPYKAGYEPAGPVQMRQAEAPDPFRAYQPLIEHINGMVADKRIRPEDGQKLLDSFAYKLGPSSGDTTLAQMSQWKTDAANEAGGNAYKVTNNPSMSKNLSKLEAKGNRDEVARAANAAFPGSGDVINETNADLGNLLTVQGVADKQAAREAKSKFLNNQDMRHMGTSIAAAGGEPSAGLRTWLLSKLADLYNAVPVRTGTGYGLKAAGTDAVTAPLIDAAAVNTLRNMTNKNQPVAGVGR
jgi:hypothetical protein